MWLQHQNAYAAMGFAPDLMHWGVYSARPDPLAGFQGAASRQGRDGRKGEERKKERGWKEEMVGRKGGVPPIFYYTILPLSIPVALQKKSIFSTAQRYAARETYIIVTRS